MNTHETTVRLPSTAVELLDRLLNKAVNYSGRQLLSVQSRLLACRCDDVVRMPAFACASEPSFDVYLVAEFEDGRRMEPMFTARGGSQSDPRMLFAGIQFADRETVRIEPGEVEAECYPLNEPQAHPASVLGTYRVFFKGDVYVAKFESE